MKWGGILNEKCNMIKYTYNEFCQDIKDITLSYGIQGFVMYTEDKAFIYFEKTPKLMLYIEGDKKFEKADFGLLGQNFDVIGKKADNNLVSFKKDIKCNWVKILIMSLFFLFIFNPWTFNKDVFLELIDKLVEVLSVFIGMVFVFIGFFYGDKERTIEVYKKGLCDKEFATDRYVLLLAFNSIVLLVAAGLLGKVSLFKFVNLLVPISICDGFLRYNIKYYVCALLVYLAIVSMIICFDALINYYLKTMRNKYLIDAVKEMASERGKNK